MSSAATLPGKRLDEERASAYLLALRIHEHAVTSVGAHPSTAPLRDALVGATVALPLWIAEAVARPPGRERRRFVALARAAALEAAELLDRLRTRRAVAADECAHARGMLARLLRQLDPVAPLRS
jgi:hypothetical protein